MNHSVVEFEAHKLSATQQGYLDAMNKAVPNVVLFSLDGGTTRYFAILGDADALKFEPYNNNEDMFNKKAYFTKARIKLNILSSTTVNFAS